MDEKFLRTEMLIGKEGMEKLKNAKVAVFGLGGVGSFVCEGLARSGIGNFVLVDFDKIDESNINRQLIANVNTIGKHKVDVMKERGIDARAIDFFDDSFTEKFDTLLFAMNGVGIVGKTENLEKFFRSIKRLLAPGGQVLLDSSDIRYIFTDDDGIMDIDLAAGYYGEVDFTMRYKNIKGEKFDWLYIDFDTLSMYAESNGFKCEKIADGTHYDYLARLTPIQQ